MHSKILNELVVYNPVNRKRRYGSSVPTGDGGYVVVDGYEYDHYIGCGVGGNASFDIEFLQPRPNMTGLIFDASINFYPRFPSHVYFVHRNIGSANTHQTTTLNNETSSYKNIFMKMDIEGHEWKWVKSFENLSNIKQFVMEIHGLFPDPSTWNWGKTVGFDSEDVYEGLKKINQTHYLIHFHSNTSAEYTKIDGKEMPTVAELTYIRKEDCAIDGLNRTPLPITGLDFVNGYDRPDLSFTEYPFCSPQ
jgi:hypothetical protein